MPSTAESRAAPGKKATQGAETRKVWPSASMLPQEMVGDCAPRPRKERPASAIMLLPTPMVAATMTGPTAFGSRWRSSSVVCPTPMARAACT